MTQDSIRSEAARLAALHRYQVLDTLPDPDLDRLTDMAARVFGVPIACVALVDDKRIWIKSGHGMQPREVGREPGLCATSIEVEGVHHLRDAALDPLAATNAVVRGGVRFYAGSALRSPEGHALGTLCVMGYEPREITEDERRTLVDLAALAMNALERHRTSLEFRHADETSRLALQESEERFRVIFDQAAVGIAQVGLDCRWLRANPKLCAITGYSERELQDLTCQQITHPDDLETNLTDLRRALASEIDSYTQEKRYVRKDGSVVWIALSVALVRDSAHVPMYFISVIEDIDERKRGEQALREAEERLRHVQKLESLGVLAGGIAHDFNNLLVGVLGNAGLALRELPEGSKAHRFVARIEHVAQRAAELTSQMLAYSGKGSFVVTSLDLNKLISSTHDLLGMAVSKNVVMQYRRASGPAWIEADGTQIRQVLMNLVSNASEAIGEAPGTIEISTGVVRADHAYLSKAYPDDRLPEGSYAYFEVVDTGCGMDRPTLQRIFEPFFTTKFTGRGLGLSAVLGIVRGHRGGIVIDTDSGHGSIFRVLFPCAPSPEPSEDHIDVDRDEVLWRGSGTVLVVDDEEVVRSLAGEVLETAGFRVIFAADGVEGVRSFHEHADEIGAVLLDVTLPGKSGRTVFRELRKIRPAVPVLFTSGYNEESISDLVGSAGPTTFLKKPYTSRALVAAFRSALGSGELGCETQSVSEPGPLEQ